MEESHKKESNFNILSFLIVILLIIVIIIVLAKYANKNVLSTNTTNTNIYETNLNNMKIKANEYFKENLPSKLGETNELSLESMINRNMLNDFTSNGNMCSLTESKAVVSKRTTNGYTIKTSLVCGNRKNYILSEIITDEKGLDIKNYIESSDCDSCLATSLNYTATNNNNYFSDITYTENTNNNNNNNQNNNNTNNNTQNKQLYYKLVKYSNWENGYLSGDNIENKYMTKTYYDYCIEDTFNYYTVSYKEKGYIGSYTYKLLLTTIPYNVKSDTIAVINSSKDYFNNINDFNKYIATRNQNISLVGGTGTNGVYSANAYQMSYASLNKNNFTYSISGVKKENNNYYVYVTINVNNNNNVNPFYATEINKNIYFIPVKFQIEYATSNTCVRSSEDNEKYYSSRGYSISNPSYENNYYHRYLTYTWSTNKNLAGYSYTGTSEYR